eukprot:5045455-Alexandrium_andersonii.AAC.1
MSAGSCSPGHLFSSKSPDLTISRAQSCPAAKCRARPTPDRRQMPIAALLSAQTLSSAPTPKPRATDTIPMPSAAPLAIPASSAAPELRAIVF